MSLPPPDPAQIAARLIRSGTQQLTVKYVIVSSMALAIVDSFQCLPSEINLVWFSEWSAIKVLYLLSRYTMLAEIPIEILYATMSSHTVSTCGSYSSAGSLLALVGVAIAEAILYVRVYALTGQRRRIAAFLLALFVAINTAAIVSHVKFLNSMEFGPSPIPSLIPCTPVAWKKQHVTSVFILVLISEMIVLVMTCWACFMTYKSSKSPLLAVCYRDGLLYFCLLALSSVANIVCNLAAPLPFSNMFAIPQRMLHGILTTRMILHMRKVGAQKVVVFGSDDTAMVPMSGSTGDTSNYTGKESMRFASRKD